MIQHEIAPVGADRPLITIITRLRTRNVGNEALSTVLIRFLKKEFPRHQIKVLERLPAAVESLVLDGVDPLRAVATFDARLRALHEQCQGPDRDPREHGDNAAPWLEVGTSLATRLMRATRHRVPVLNRVLALREYRKRFALYRRSALVIANPAGEFDPNYSAQTPARLLMDLQMAKLAGARTAVINHSVEISDPSLSSIVAATYGSFDAVVVREAGSKATIVELGVEPSHVTIAPDAVFALEVPRAARLPLLRGESLRVGLALNPTTRHANSHVADHLVREVLDRGLEPVAVSNCWHVDEALWKPLTKKYPLQMQPRPLSFEQYVEFLASLDVIASARLHTNIFGLVCGIPCIPLEGNLFRIESLLGDGSYPLPVIHLGAPDWKERVGQAMQLVISNGSEIDRQLARYVEAKAQEVRRIYSSTFHSILSGAGNSS